MAESGGCIGDIYKRPARSHFVQEYLQLWCCGVNTDSLGRDGEKQPHAADACGLK